MADDEERAARESWLFESESRAARPYVLLHLSSHGLLLQQDVRRAFLAEAWAYVIVMAQAVIEAKWPVMLRRKCSSSGIAWLPSSCRLIWAPPLKSLCARPSTMPSSAVGCTTCAPAGAPRLKLW
jgi:hypothetical protein